MNFRKLEASQKVSHEMLLYSETDLTTVFEYSLVQYSIHLLCNYNHVFAYYYSFIEP